MMSRQTKTTLWSRLWQKIQKLTAQFFSAARRVINNVTTIAWTITCNIGAFLWSNVAAPLITAGTVLFFMLVNAVGSAISYIANALYIRGQRNILYLQEAYTIVRNFDGQKASWLSSKYLDIKTLLPKQTPVAYVGYEANLLAHSIDAYDTSSWQGKAIRFIYAYTLVVFFYVLFKKMPSLVVNILTLGLFTKQNRANRVPIADLIESYIFPREYRRNKITASDSSCKTRNTTPWGLLKTQLKNIWIKNIAENFTQRPITNTCRLVGVISSTIALIAYAALMNSLAKILLLALRVLGIRNTSSYSQDVSEGHLGLLGMHRYTFQLVWNYLSLTILHSIDYAGSYEELRSAKEAQILYTEAKKKLWALFSPRAANRQAHRLSWKERFYHAPFYLALSVIADITSLLGIILYSAIVSVVILSMQYIVDQVFRFFNDLIYYSTIYGFHLFYFVTEKNSSFWDIKLRDETATMQKYDDRQVNNWGIPLRVINHHLSWFFGIILGGVFGIALTTLELVAVGINSMLPGNAYARAWMQYFCNWPHPNGTPRPTFSFDKYSLEHTRGLFIMAHGIGSVAGMLFGLATSGLFWYIPKFLLGFNLPSYDQIHTNDWNWNIVSAGYPYLNTKLDHVLYYLTKFNLNYLVRNIIIPCVTNYILPLGPMLVDAVKNLGAIGIVVFFFVLAIIPSALYIIGNVCTGNNVQQAALNSLCGSLIKMLLEKDAPEAPPPGVAANQHTHTNALNPTGAPAAPGVGPAARRTAAPNIGGVTVHRMCCNK